jgi:hypothetical protein
VTNHKIKIEISKNVKNIFKLKKIILIKKIKKLYETLGISFFTK